MMALQTPPITAGPTEQMKFYVRQLLRGNVRYLKNEPKPKMRGGDKNLRQVMSINSRYPPVAVLSCADARVKPELLFDVEYYII